MNRHARSPLSKAAAAVSVAMLVCWGILCPSASMAATAPPDLSGSWAMVQVTSDYVEYPFAGRRKRTTYLMLRLEIDQSGTSLLIRETHCSAYVDDGTDFVATEIPGAFLRSIGEVERTASLHRDGSGWRFVYPWGVTVHGAVLEDPARDPLPTDAEDPRVFDQDEDGKPGITVRVTILGLGGGEVYAVQRLTKHLEGPVISEDRLEGLIDWTNEQVIIDAQEELLKMDVRAEADPVAENSRFVAVRVPADLPCVELAVIWRVLFGL